MLLLPFVRLRKFYAFLPVLRTRLNSGYKHAGRAYALLWVGLAFVVALLANVVAILLCL